MDVLCHQDLDPSEYTSEHFHTIPIGAKNGEKKGLKMILDVETFDYAYFTRCDVTFLPKALCSKYLYFQRPFLQKTFVQKNFSSKDLFFKRPFLQKTFAQKTLCSKDPMFKSTFVQKTFVQKTFSSKDLCSKDLCSKDLCSKDLYFKRPLLQKTFV